MSGLCNIQITLLLEMLILKNHDGQIFQLGLKRDISVAINNWATYEKVCHYAKAKSVIVLSGSLYLQLVVRFTIQLSIYQHL